MSVRLRPFTATAVFLTLIMTAHAQQDGARIVIPVAASAADAEEFITGSPQDPQRWPPGYTYTSSSDLELGRDPDHGPQIVALRFAELPLPVGTTIETAFLRFTADSDGDGTLALGIALGSAASDPFVEDADESAGFGLSSRADGPPAIEWYPEPWAAGNEYESPELRSLLQQAVDRPDWTEGSPLVLILTPLTDDPAAYRSAWSFDASSDLAPELVVEYRVSEAVGDDEAEAEAVQPERREVPEAPEGEENDGEGPPAEPTDSEEEPAAPTSAGAGQPQRAVFRIEPQHADEVTGRVMVSDYGLRRTILSVALEGTSSGSEYRAVLHRGGCNSVDTLRTLLEPVRGDLGISTSVLDVGVEELLGQPHHVNIHRLGEFTRLVGCAQLTG